MQGHQAISHEDFPAVTILKQVIRTPGHVLLCSGSLHPFAVSFHRILQVWNITAWQAWHRRKAQYEALSAASGFPVSMRRACYPITGAGYVEGSALRDTGQNEVSSSRRLALQLAAPERAQFGLDGPHRSQVGAEGRVQEAVRHIEETRKRTARARPRH